MKQLDLFRKTKRTIRSNSWCYFSKNGMCYGEIIGIKTGRDREDSYLVRCICDKKPVRMFRKDIISFHDTEKGARLAHAARFRK